MGNNSPLFVVCGKTEDTQYSVRTAAGEAVCTCAYNSNFGARQEWAEIIAQALNAWASAAEKEKAS